MAAFTYSTQVSTVQYCVVQYSTVQYSTLLHPGHAGEEDGSQAGEAEQGEPRGGREPPQDRQRAHHGPAQQVSTRYLDI